MARVFVHAHLEKYHGQVIQAVTQLDPPVGGHLILWNGHLTIPKRSQRIARGIIFPGAMLLK